MLAATGDTDNSYRFAGEQYDAGLEQYYLRARYYDQASGRFTQQDRWMGNETSPITLQKYLYANTDPVNNTDPTGRFAMSIGGLMSGVRGVGILNTVSYSSMAKFVGVGLIGSVVISNGTQCNPFSNKRCNSVPTLVFGADMPVTSRHIQDAQNGLGTSVLKSPKNKSNKRIKGVRS
uniref:RHS repeat-associated core domain-containing protein n=1 Tax=Gallaecimonas sp. GXIMD4217 TaxID=3131927 RepID=UPI00404AA4EF